jgi:RNA-directed DNA polymerase
MQALYLLALDPVSETMADPNSYGFRRGRCTADAIEACFIALCQKDRAQWILEGDSRSCFDRISHTWLLTHIPMQKAMLAQWLKAGDLEKRRLFPTEEGTPQGGICSPVIANMALDGLERLLAAHFPKTGKESKRAKVNLIRYADGKYQTGKEAKFFIPPSKKNVKAFLAKIRKHIKKSRDLTAGELITELNPQMRGWALYHRHAVSKDVFHAVDHEIFKALWDWAQRRHRHKTRWWIKDKYWPSTGLNRWVFTGILKGEEGQTKVLHLLSADSIRIKRHTKIRAEANPDDPAWEPYFEKRLDVQMCAALKGRRWLQHLWKEQSGLCPLCQQKITKITGWHSHHILWRSKGGSDGTENRVLLHPNCHQQVHSQSLHVEKPRPVKRAE